MRFRVRLMREKGRLGCRRKDADVHALLWESRRLHAVVLRAEQLVKMAPPQPGRSTVGILLSN